MEIEGGMKEKLLEALLEMFTKMPDQAEAELTVEAKPEAGMGKMAEAKEELC